MPGGADLLTLLVQRGWLPETEVRRVRSQARADGRATIHAIRAGGQVPDAVLLELLRDQLGLAEVDPGDEEAVDLEALRWLSQDVAEAELVLPLALESRGGQRVVRLAMADPLNGESVQRVQEATGHVVDPVLAEAGPLQRAIGRFYGRVTTRLIPRPDTRSRPLREGGGWSPGAGLEPETQPVHRLEDEATPAQMVQAMVQLLERKGLVQHAEFVEELKAILRGDSEG
jgi:hypothetical protein